LGFPFFNIDKKFQNLQSLKDDYAITALDELDDEDLTYLLDESLDLDDAKVYGKFLNFTRLYNKLIPD